MGTLIRAPLVILFWAVAAAVILAAMDSDARLVLESYIPYFSVLDPAIDWLANFAAALWQAIRS